MTIRRNGMGLCLTLAALLHGGCGGKPAPRTPRPPVAAAPTPRPSPSPAPTAPARAAATPAAFTTIPAPVIRIGFAVDAPRVVISAERGMRVVTDGGTTERARVTVTLAPGAAREAVRFRVQVGSYADERQALDVARRVVEATGFETDAPFNEATRTYQVKAGRFAAREDAAAASRRLAGAGYEGAFVSTEAPSGAAAGRVALADTGETTARAYFEPADASDVLSIDGATVRGLVEVLAGPAGVTAVNVLNVEEYLRGVVPNELSPLQFPQLEAHKAQAVAARTYALRNMGQFKDRGYDICATPACQVYRGASTEHPLTDRAIAETRGVVARHRGELINALFTSTCGGHTEDGFNVFPTQTQPYLKGIPCEAEIQRVSVIRALAPVARLGHEPALNRDVALLMALDVVGAGAERAPWLAANLRAEEAESWVARLLRSVSRRGCEPGAPKDLARRGAFFAYLTAALCWNERVSRLLSASEARFLQSAEDAAEFASVEESRAAALLVQEEVLTPSAAGRLEPRATLTRAQAVGLLARAALRIGPPSLDRAEFAGGVEGEVRFRLGDAVQTLRTSDRIRIFRDLSGVPVAASEIALTQGDRVRYIASEDGKLVFLVAEQSRFGTAADRTSRFYRWEERLTPDAIARTVRRYGDPGVVRDVEILRTGISGRAIELVVRGTARDVVLKGLDIRFALGVRENLFVIDRELAADGSVRRFVITGKGWGHGVGLCQVGAYGMAQAGATYEEIIRRYYTGVELDSAPR